MSHTGEADKALHVGPVDLRNVLPKTGAVGVNQALAVGRLLVLHPGKGGCGRGKALPELLGQIAIYPAVLLLEGDGQGHDLLLR